jgi:4-hydroxy-4-methyl-2-oxoglutarate aldolase
MNSPERVVVPPPDFIEALRLVDSATVANAVEGLGVRRRTEGYADLRLRCLVAQPRPMVGFAVTVAIDSTSPGRTPDNALFGELLAAVDSAPKPCVVVCQEAGPAPERGCHMGDVVGTRLARRGVVGVVSGSGIRDLPGIRTAGLSAFALGTVVAHGVWTITAVGAPAEVAGLRIRPGDLLHGNQDGLLAVPWHRPGDLLRLIEDVRSREARSRAAAGPGAELPH